MQSLQWHLGLLQCRDNSKQCVVLAARDAWVLTAVNELETHHGHQECRNLCGKGLWR